MNKEEQIFTDAYVNDIWGPYGGYPETKSGLGSTLRQTVNIRRELPLLLERHNITSMLDIPCGDFNWMQHVDLGYTKYIGADIVPVMIEDNKKRFPSVDFRTLNLLTDDLPKVDLVMCRDCLFHMSFSNIHRALTNIQRSGAKYILTTSYTWKAYPNEDCVDDSSGRVQWTRLNLFLPPFNLPQPVDFIFEGTAEDPTTSDRTLFLWRCGIV